MLYDLGNILDRERFQRRCAALLEAGKVAELSDRSRRTTRQNSYLHLLLGWFAMETGNTLEYVKREYFKRLVNRDIFVTERDDKWLGRTEDYRSTADLSSAELSTAIDRFRDWSSREAGIYLPEANEERFLKAIEVEMSRMKRYI